MKALSGDEGLSKVRYPRALRFGHLCNQHFTVCGSSLQDAARSNKCTYALSIGVCPDRMRAGRTVSVRFEVTVVLVVVKI